MLLTGTSHIHLLLISDGWLAGGSLFLYRLEYMLLIKVEEWLKLFANFPSSSSSIQTTRPFPLNLLADLYFGKSRRRSAFGFCGDGRTLLWATPKLMIIFHCLPNYPEIRWRADLWPRITSIEESWSSNYNKSSKHQALNNRFKRGEENKSRTIIIIFSQLTFLIGIEDQRQVYQSVSINKLRIFQVI